MRLMQDVLSEHVNMSAGLGRASLMDNNIIENLENENGRYKKWGHWDWDIWDYYTVSRLQTH